MDTPSGKLQSESNLETVITTAKTPPAAGQDETTIIDSVSSAPSLEETDLSTLIDETDREKAGPMDRTTISSGQGTVESGGAETVIYGPKEHYREETLSPDQGTLITSYPADQAPQAQPPRSFPVHEEKKPGSPAKGPSKKSLRTWNWTWKIWTPWNGWIVRTRPVDGLENRKTRAPLFICEQAPSFLGFAT